MLFVLLAHTKVSGFDGQGAIGVYLFFALSGFLLTLPLGKWEQATSRSRFLVAYFTRRLLRILPMYYCLLTALFLSGQRDLDWLRQHAIFISADDHLWSVRQELIFYLLLPGIFIVLTRAKNSMALLAAVAVAGFVTEACICFIGSYFRSCSPWALTGV